MSWNLTNDVREYLARAEAFVRRDAAENTVLISVAENLRVHGSDVYGDEPPLFGWWHPDRGDVGGAFLVTRPHSVLLGVMPERAAAELAEVLADRGVPVPGINAGQQVAAAFGAGWQRRTGTAGQVLMRQRLYRLGHLDEPAAVPGSARVAGACDYDLVLAWCEAFAADTAGLGLPAKAIVDDRLGYGGVMLWEVDGVPVSMAGRSRILADMARVGPVYTPPEHRRHGYGAAATAAVTRLALDAGARELVLFTDLANPTSNSIYQRLGYRPVSDRVILAFGASGGS